MRVRAISTLCWVLLAAGCSEGPGSSPTSDPPPPSGPVGSNSVAQLVSASQGGIVDFHQSEVVLNVPPQSLTADTTIGIERITDLPSGESDGLGAFGQAYRCTPAGTQFSLVHPAQMVMHYDATALAAKGYDPSTLQLYYFDEPQHRYFNVPTIVDLGAQTLTAPSSISRSTCRSRSR